MPLLSPRRRIGSRRIVAVRLTCALFAQIAIVCNSGCSFLVDVGKDQCARNSDCEGVGLSGTCEQGVCVALEEPEPPAGAGSSGAGGVDAGVDAAPPPNDDSCLGSLSCEGDKICFKDQCVVERDVERFVCDPTEPEELDLVPFEMPVVEFVSEQPPKNMKALACRPNDVSCADPEGMFEDKDGRGVIRMELPRGFDGFLEVTSDDALPALWYFTKPLVTTTRSKTLRVVAPSSLMLLAAVSGLSTDASKGLVILEAFDCNKVAVGGVHFAESKRTALPFYIVNGIPNTESTVTVRNEMDDEAPGGFVNATPGFTRFTASIGIEGPLLGEFNANVRASTVTYLDIHP